jgi:hypothetical protein
MSMDHEAAKSMLTQHWMLLLEAETKTALATS